MISDYIEGELSERDKEQIENHFDECTTCSKITSRISKLQNNLKNLRRIQTSTDFETVLRTRIRIESGIGRRRLHEIIWSWPARIPIYGMSIALIIIAIVLVIEQVNISNQSPKPDPFTNNEWYGGNPNQKLAPPLVEETETVIEVYDLDRVAPKTYTNIKDSSKQIEDDSLRILDNRIKQVHQITY